MRQGKTYLRKDDQVEVIAGKDKGRVGKVLRVLRDKDKVVVERINMIKRHTRPSPNQGKPGGIIEREAAMHVSNIAIFNSESNSADRVGIQVDDDGMKKRVFKSNGQDID